MSGASGMHPHRRTPRTQSGPARRPGRAWRRLAWLCAVLLGAAVGADAQVERMAPLEVVANRVSPDPGDAPVVVRIFTAADLTSFAAVTLDDTLREDPAFSLFRRTSSLTSNPTSQGVSLRGIGPSGASRSLVVLDGVPLNDPFGGWVLWSAVPRLSVTQVRITHGGGSGIWGNAALAGVVTLTESPPAAGAGRAMVEVGDYSTGSAEVALAEPAGAGTVSADVAAFSTAGFQALLPASRGPVDRPLWSHHQLAELSVREPVGRAIEARVTGRLFGEERGNGTILQKNATRLGLVSLDLEGTPQPDFAWNAVAYVEQERFSALFSAVNASRTVETPSDDQFAVPATAAGAALTADWRTDRSRTEVGADFRRVTGETRERVQYTAGAFATERFAGGAQGFVGVFIHHEQELDPRWRLVLDARADHWRNRDGHDRESSLLTGAPTMTSNYRSKTGDAFSPNLGLVGKLSPTLRLHAAAYHGFRLPTLNEYYRPFRVGNVTTQANPDLKAETLDGAEAGADVGSGKLQGSVTGFVDELHDAVGTILVSQSAAGRTVQRTNLESVRARGIEAAVRWRPGADLEFNAGWLLADSRVRRASAEPGLQGLRLPEVPRHTVTAQASWQAPGGVVVRGRVRWVSLQFDDPENTLRLPGAAVVDLQLSRRFGQKTEAYFAVENAGDARLAASLSSSGLTTYDAPRMVRGGVRIGW